jgi:predicted ATPase
MRRLPPSPVTLLFTDIDGSTRLLHQLGQEAYAEALAEHRRVLREVFDANGGVEVDTQGDAFFVAFSSAAEAVAAAAEAQSALATGRVLVRMGLHTGTPHVTAEGYVGEDVHLGARVAAAGHGGQVLLSKATVELVEGELTDLGEHRLKDFEQAVWIYQLGDTHFPPLKTISNTNLPRPASSFVGREREIAEVEALLREGARLVTLTGPGGSGKTRLAIEAASELVGEFRNGVFWVALATLRDPELVLPTIAQTLGTQEEPAAYIGEKELLLLLDNLEQVVEAAPALAGLVEACPNLGLLVTSRELLRIRGEVEYEVLPLVDSEAVALFCTRAQLHASPPIEELCGRLDNMPLALELAAARAKVLSPEQMLERLGERLDLFKGGRDANPRQRTLRATIEWSHDLLTPDERRLFAWLAVFAGGCTLDSAHEVCDADLDTLQSLVEKSLVRHTSERFWMLETIREFALDRLEATGETLAARTRYRSWMLHLSEEARIELEGPDQDAWLERLHEEQANVREVLTLALDAGDAEVTLRIAAGLSRYFWLRPAEPLGWLERGLALREGVPQEVVADALRAAGETAWFLGDHALALQRFREGLALFEVLGDEGGRAKMLTRLGPPLLSAGRPDEAAELLERAVALHRRLGQQHELAITLSLLASIALERGDRSTATDLYGSSLALARELGDSMITSNSLVNLSEAALRADDPEQAMTLAREALEISWRTHDLITVVFSLGALAWTSSARGELRRAAILWGAVERLDGELGETMWRNERDEYEARLRPVVLEDEVGLSEGRALEMDQAVELALGS